MAEHCWKAASVPIQRVQTMFGICEHTAMQGFLWFWSCCDVKHGTMPQPQGSFGAHKHHDEQVSRHALGPDVHSHL